MVSHNLNQDRENEVESWFDNMVAELRYDQTLLENEIMEEDTKKFYNALIKGDENFLHDYARKTSSAFFITNMVKVYMMELIKSHKKPNKIALELSNSKILVWAETLEDDESMEDVLILTEAKVNSLFSKYGFHISSTIVENCDGLEVPDHYKEVAIS